MSCQFFSLTGPPAQQGPPLNPEKEAETPGSLFEILTPGEFYEDVRSSFLLTTFIQSRTYSTPVVHPRKPALYIGSNKWKGLNGIIRSRYDHIPEQEGGFNPDHSPARTKSDGVIIRRVRTGTGSRRSTSCFPSICIHTEEKYRGMMLKDRCVWNFFLWCTWFRMMKY